MAMVRSVLTILLLLAAVAPQQTWGLLNRHYRATPLDCSSLDADVLVLGAGMTGISAAKTLSENNISDFLILEGMTDIGGRVRSVPFGGVNVELGANWIQGVLGDNDSEVNPLWLLKEKYKLEGNVTDSAFVLYTEDGVRVPDDDVKKLNKRFNKACRSVEKEARERRRKKNLKDVSIRAALRLAGWEPNSGAELFKEWFGFDFCFAESPDLTSLLRNIPLTTYEDFGPEEFFVTDQRGFSILIKKLAEQYLTPSDPRLHLNETVQSVEWGDCCVCATTDLKRYCATTAIHTFSIGTLQHETVKFVPNLPKWKRRSINTYSMAYYLKIFVEFPFVFWDDSVYIGYGSLQRGYYPHIQSLNLFFPESPIVVLTVTQDEAWRLSHQSEQQTTNEIWELFQTIYGNDVPEPKAILVTDWVTNPFFHGMYSNTPTGVHKSDLSNLRQPLGSLVFGGEALSDYNGFLHGSFLSGITVAAEAGNFVNTCKKADKE